jgi:hypothetical protein
MPRTVDSVYPLTRRAMPVKPYRLKIPPQNCETRQPVIIIFPNPQRKERRFLPGLKARVSTPNI